MRYDDDMNPMMRRGHHGHPRGRGGRRPRGEVRTAVLLLLAEQPMHGYQLMDSVAERSGGRWRPSPGALYPTLHQLEDDGLITVSHSAGRRLAALTDEGRALVERERSGWSDPFTSTPEQQPGDDLRSELGQLHDAVRVVGRNGTDDQRAQAVRLLAQTRRAVYLLLAGEPTPTVDTDTGTTQA